LCASAGAGCVVGDDLDWKRLSGWLWSWLRIGNIGQEFHSSALRLGQGGPKRHSKFISLESSAQRSPNALCSLCALISQAEDRFQQFPVSSGKRFQHVSGLLKTCTHCLLSGGDLCGSQGVEEGIPLDLGQRIHEDLHRLSRPDPGRRRPRAGQLRRRLLQSNQELPTGFFACGDQSLNIADELRDVRSV
jgi:hypothetical protein